MLLVGICCWSQQAKQYSFTHFTTETGLASNYVNRIIQDQYGYIWIATINGLQRYDGKRFLTFRNEPGNSHSLPSENIALLQMDSQGNLWVFTVDNKVGQFDVRTFRYTEFPIRHVKNLTSYHSKNLMELPDGSLILYVLHQAMYRLDTKTNTFKPDYSIFKVPQNWKIWNIFYDAPQKRYWITCDSGLVKHNPVNGMNSYRGHNVENDPVIDMYAQVLYTYDLQIDRRGRVYFCSWKPTDGAPTFYIYDHQKKRSLNYNLSFFIGYGYHEINGMLEQKNGRVWVYGRPFIAEYIEAEKPFDVVRNEYYGEQSIKLDVASHLFEDNQQNIWISSTNGIFLFNPDLQVFNSYALIRPEWSKGVEGNVQATVELPNGDLWVGCWGTGVYAYDSNYRPKSVPASLRPYQETASVWDMIYHESSGRVWICLQAGGLILYDTRTGKTQKVFPSIFKGITIRQVTEDKQGNLWFGTQGGRLIKWDQKESGGDPMKGYTNMRRMGLIQRLRTDSQGYIWVASLSDAVYRIDPVNNTVLEKISRTGPENFRLGGESPSDVIQYNDSIFVIACGSVDIVNIKSRKIEHITTQDGLPSNTVLCVESDQQGILWLAMLNGLSRMNLQKKIFTFYDRRDGINNDNFVIAGNNKLKNGRIVLCTDHNFVVFDPKGLIRKDVPPDVRITDFKLNNRALSVDSVLNESRLQLDYDKNSLDIEFSSMSYLKQNKIIYYYMLEGLDKEWVQADDRQQAIYNYLKPGNYTFRIKCENGDGIQSRNITLLNIRVKPPFWQTWWFYCLVALTGLGILFWFDRERVRKLMALQQVRTQIAGNLHNDINITLNNINLLSELAKIKADKDIDKSKEFIDQINEKSRRMIEAMDDMVWSIQPENDSMQKTLDRMNQFAQGLQFTYGFRMLMMVDEKVKSLKLDMKVRHEIFLIFKEAMNNIARHSGARNAVVNMDLQRSGLWMKIQDDGNGFDLARNERSRGIREMRKRAANMKAQLDIQSYRSGTAIVLNIPV